VSHVLLTTVKGQACLVNWDHVLHATQAVNDRTIIEFADGTTSYVRESPLLISQRLENR